MARTVTEVRQFLEVLAGPDGLDPRQGAAAPLAPPSFSRPQDLRVGIVEEGFGWPGRSDPGVDDAVEAAARSFAGTGAQVRVVSVPAHRVAPDVLAAVRTELGWMVFENDAVGTLLGSPDGEAVTALARGWRRDPRMLPLAAKYFLLAGIIGHGRWHGSAFWAGRAWIRELAAAYDEALDGCDVLVMPTTTTPARPLLAPDAPVAQRLQAAWSASINTGAFNSTGHPALSVPAGLVEGLPAGMMLVGRRGQDATVLAAGELFQREVFAPGPPPLPRPA
jgi:amidase